MKLIFYITSIFTLITLTTTTSKAQDNGFYIGANVQATAWTMPSLDLDTESGGGFGIKAGYNINTNLGVFLGLDGASINPPVGEDYGLGHFDIGVEGRIGNSESKFLPYGRLSYLGMAAVEDNPSGDIEITGTGFGLGGGFYYFFTDNLALDVALVKSWVNIEEVKVGTISTSLDEDAETGRFLIGLSFHF
jgi:opacity protein-like surface antigen